MTLSSTTNCLSATVLASLLGVIALPGLFSAAQGATIVPTHVAPGPLVGAGLPVLVIAGGAYWVVRRLRRKGS